MGRMSDVAETESYLLGEIDERDLAALQQHGVIVQVLEDRPEETPGGKPSPHRGLDAGGSGPSRPNLLLPAWIPRSQTST